MKSFGKNRMLSFGAVWVLLLSLSATPLSAESYQYDPAGRLTSVNYDNGSAIIYMYDPAGNRTAILKQALSDKDIDGIPDISDNCPSDVNSDQSDVDGDDVGDVCDECANDPDKTEPGVCGCGEVDIDTDEDGDMDCIDPDDDNDGMPDDWENSYGLNPLLSDAGEDLDNDGLTNYEEYLGGSDPTDRNDPRPRFIPWLPILLE